MRRILGGTLAALAALAFAASPAAAQEDGWFDWDWGSGYEFGEEEYGYGLDGTYDNEDETDDWYYDEYEYGGEEDETVGFGDTYMDSDTYSEWYGDEGLYDESYYEDERLYEGEGLYEGYGYDDETYDGFEE